MRKIYLIFLLLVILAVSALILYSSLRSRDAFSENLIISLSKNLEKELAAYLNPVREEFSRILVDYYAFSGEQMDEDSLSARLIPEISGIPAIGSVMLYNSSGYIYSIYREKNTFVSSLENLETEQAALVWSRRMNDNSVSSRWTEVLIGQEDRLEVMHDILDRIASDDESVIWTGIYQSRNLKEPVITAAADWTSGLDSSIFICSFEMPVRLIIRHLNSFNRFSKRRIFMAMTSGQLVDIPSRLPDTIRSLEEQFREGLDNTIQDSILYSFIKSWEQIGGEVDMTFHQELDKEEWWVHIRDFQTFDRIAAVGLAMPESSLKLGLIKNHSSKILVLIFLLLSILIYLAAAARRRQAKSAREKSSGHPATDQASSREQDPGPIGDNSGRPDSGTGGLTSDSERPDNGSGGLTPDSADTDWKAIIAKGENQSVEFKSALRMDMNLGKVNTALENVIIKSIAAFSNGEGGTLFIGVRDDGSIQGIQEDLATLKKQDSDFFEIHLRNLLKQQFGVTFMTRNIGIEFPKIEDREICVIRIIRGTEPAYVNMVDKHGNKTERFYVRSGNSSQEIQSLKEINEYISKRF